MKYTSIDTPAGPLTVVASDIGAVVAAGFTAHVAELTATTAPAPVHHPELGGVTKAVHAYLDGELAALDQVPVAAAGGDFHSAVWRALREIPPGTTVSYTQLAAQAGRPTAVRAAANACARNRVALFVPCHRVLPVSGGPGGYRWGSEVKHWLLRHERASQR